MYQFKNDYSELACEEIMQALMKYFNEQNIAYGLDKHSENAERLILEKFNSKNGKVFFLNGGTQTNTVFISYVLRPYEAVISLETGHINVHETGSVEASGHKIITVKGKNGKIYPSDIEKVILEFNNEHMVKPKMVYISNSTEIGTIYNKEELVNLKTICDKYHLYFFIDGARLGSALTSKENDVNPEILGEICDAFYVGGTKNGLLYGEALLINNPDLARDFRFHIKNRGATLAKGYGVGIQFERAFKDDLYFSLARHTNEVASYLKEEFKKLNVKMLDSPTNQIFAFFSSPIAKKIIDNFGVEVWYQENDIYCLRFVTSFNTTNKDVDELIAYLKDNI